MPQEVMRGADGWICTCCMDTLYCSRLLPNQEPDRVNFVEVPFPEPLGRIHRMTQDILDILNPEGRGNA